MADAPSWITAIATAAIAITAIVSSYIYYKLLLVSIAKDKPLVRAYIQRIKNPDHRPLFFVKNEEGGRADKVTLDIGGRKFPPFSLKVNETQFLPVDVTDGLIIDRLTYEDIHGHTTTENTIVPKTITTDFGMR